MLQQFTDASIRSKSTGSRQCWTWRRLVAAIGITSALLMGAAPTHAIPIEGNDDEGGEDDASLVNVEFSFGDNVMGTIFNLEVGTTSSAASLTVDAFGLFEDLGPIDFDFAASSDDSGGSNAFTTNADGALTAALFSVISADGLFGITLNTGGGQCPTVEGGGPCFEAFATDENGVTTRTTATTLTQGVVASEIPEPTSLALLGIGLLASTVVGARRTRR